MDSRDVAKMMGLEHKEILMMIKGQKDGKGNAKHTGILATLIRESGVLRSTGYFIESSYRSQGSYRSYPC